MNPVLKGELLHLIDGFVPQKLLVVGDLMLDQYTWGKVSRISPEAPIPVVSVEREEHRLGGSASVVANLRKLDCLVEVIGLIGQDQAGQKLKQNLLNLGVGTQGLVLDSAFPTIVKNRILTDQQQLVRVDYEFITKLTAEQKSLLLNKAREMVPQVAGVVLSDYAKGVIFPELVQEIVGLARQRGIPVVCDPGKGVNPQIYRGVTTIKPNRLETEQATGQKLHDQESILAAAGKMKELCQADFLSISLDKDGILYYRDAKDYRFLETEVLEVFDVTGAGDMVISVIAALLSSGVEPIKALSMANVAAELEISHRGVVPLPWSDIAHHLRKDGIALKIVTLEQLQQKLAQWSEISLVFTNGYFDQISAGHLRFLQETSRFAGKLVVAINSDACILRQKGQAPLLAERDRARLLASLENVQWVVIFEEDNASRLIAEIKPKVIVKGRNFEGVTLPEAEAIQRVGARVEYIDFFSFAPHA